MVNSSLIDDQVDANNSKKLWNTETYNQKKIRGLNAYFISENLKRPLETFIIEGKEMQYVHRNIREFVNLKK